MSRVFNRTVIFDGAVRVTAERKVAVSGAATLHRKAGVVTTEALVTAQNAIYTLTVTNRLVTADSMVFVKVENGTNTQGTPQLGTVTTSNGSVAIQVINKHATSQAFNGTLRVSFFVVDPQFNR